MSPLRALLHLAIAATTAACTYGPVEDYSRFNGAALLPDGRVAVSYHRLTYRPAKGLAAFPDGGIPKYLHDWHAILLVEQDGKTRQIAAFPGGGLQGSGEVTLMPAGGDPDTLLLHRYAQQTTSLPLRFLSEFVRMRPDGSIIEKIDLSAALANEGRTLGAKGFGTLVVLDRAGRMLLGAERGGVRELWLREPGRPLTLIDRFDDYRGRNGDTIVYMRDGLVIIRGLDDGSQIETDWRDPRAGKFAAQPEAGPGAIVSMDGRRIRITDSAGEREIFPDVSAATGL